MTQQSTTQPLDFVATYKVMGEVIKERERQHAKWGQQDHPNGTGDDRHLLRNTDLPTYGTHAYLAKDLTDRSAKGGTLTYADVFLEEVFEALAEQHVPRLRAELVQVAAVAVAWIEKLDRAQAATAATALSD